jgi:tetrahedral aminopeptidase
MDLDLELLEQMLEFNSVVGNEHVLAQWLVGKLEPHASRVEMDRLGNIFAWRGESPAVAISAHLDSVGFLVEEVREDHVKVVKMGSPQISSHMPVIVETEQGVVRGTLVAQDKDLLIDLWEPETASQVQIGDIAAFAPNFRVDEGRVHSRWLDNKLGLWVAIESWKAAERAIFVGTVREEHSPAGAGAAVQRVPGLELAIVIDITYSSSPEEPYIVSWGKGPTVGLRDAQVYDLRWARAMLQVAKAHEIPAQPEIARSGGTDARHINLAGFPAVFIGLPIRYAHTPAEVARLSDCEHARDLILRFLERYSDGQLVQDTAPGGAR